MKRVTCQRRTLLLLTGLLLICISIFDQPGSVKAAVNKGKVRQAYEKQLKTLDQKWKKYYANWDGGNYFCYYDINRDGVEECLVYRSFRKEGNTITCTGGTDVAVYTYYQGKVKQLVYSTPIGGNWGAIRFYKDSKYIERFERVGWAYNANRFQAIKNGKLTTIGTCEQRIHSTTYKPSYKVRKKAASEKSYRAFLKKMEGTKGVTMYKITAKNLKKFA